MQQRERRLPYSTKEEEEGQKNNCQSWLTKDGCYVISAYCIQAKVFRHPIGQFPEKIGWNIPDGTSLLFNYVTLNVCHSQC